MEPRAQEAYVELYGDSHTIAEGGCTFLVEHVSRDMSVMPR